MELLIWNYFGKNMVIIGDPVGDKASVSFRSTKSMSCFLHVGCEKMFCLRFYFKSNFYYDKFAVHAVKMDFVHSLDGNHY